MNNKELFKEVYSDMVMKSGEESANAAFEAYDNMELAIKFSTADLLACDELDQLAWPKTAAQFGQMLGVVKNFLGRTSQKAAIDAVDAVLAYIPKEQVQASAVTAFAGEPDKVKDARHNSRPASEPDVAVLSNVVSDYVKMNGVDSEIVQEIRSSIAYYAERIVRNEFRVSPAAGIDEDKAMALARRKLAAYYNLHSGGKDDLPNPELVVKGNRAVLEVALYNGFIVSIVTIAGSWKARIFDKVDKASLVKPALYHLVYDAIASCVSGIVLEEMDAFVKECKKDSKANPYLLTEGEKVVLDELYLALLGKKMPLSLR